MQVNKSLLDYYKNVSSDAPAPGGGSVSAYFITLGLGLYLMSIRVSIKRKKFQAYDDNIKNSVYQNIEELDNINLAILEYVDKDIETFNKFMEAYRAKDEERIKVETINCFYGPYEVVNLMFKAIDIIVEDYQFVVKSILSDLKISLMVINNFLDVEQENMEVNLKNIDDVTIQKIAEKVFEKISSYKKEIAKILENF